MTPAPQRRRRRSDLDALIDLYRRMSDEDRLYVIPVIRGIERFTKAQAAIAEEQQTFEELGERVAEETI